MANRTDKEAGTIKGTNPQNLVEYILRQKIYDSLYWKQDCFGLSAEKLVDKAVQLRFGGGMFGEPQKPTEFICLVLKMLQIQPEKEIILEFIKNDDFKYLRLLGAFYLRLTGRAVDVFNYLEPLLNDYRRVRVRDPSGNFSLAHMDELVNTMLRSDHMFNIALPRLPARQVLEKAEQLEPRVSVLEDEFNEVARIEEEEAAMARKTEAEAKRAEEAAREAVAQEEERKTRREKWQLNPRDSRRGRDRGEDDREEGEERRRGRSRSRSGERRHGGGDDDYYKRGRGRSRSRDKDDAGGGSYRGGGSRRGDRSRSRDRHRQQQQQPSRRRYDDDEFGDRRRRKHRGESEERREPKRAKGEEGGEGGEKGGSKEALSVEETNKLRAQLGLPPLK